MTQPDFPWPLLSFILTVMILSYVIGDNPLFKIASYLFVGISAGYVTVLVIYQIIVAKMINPFFANNPQHVTIAVGALVLCAMLVLKLFPQFNAISSLPMAFLVGVGSASIISGALLGTFIPQIDATTQQFSLAGNGNILLGVYVLFGSIVTLLYFQHSKISKIKITNDDSKIYVFIRNLGKIFIGITLGSIFAGIILSALFALIERVNYLITFVINIRNGL